MADFLCADFNEADFDTNCVGPGNAQSARRSPRYGLTRRAVFGLLGLVSWLKP